MQGNGEESEEEYWLLVILCRLRSALCTLSSGSEVGATAGESGLRELGEGVWNTFDTLRFVSELFSGHLEMQSGQSLMMGK